MTDFLDTERWARRDAFEFFRGFDKPYFNVCTRLDVAPLKQALAQSPGTGGGLSLALYYLALRVANEQQPFRLRLEGGRVRIHPVVHASTTVLRDDDSFSFAYLEHAPSFAAFAAQAGQRIEAARRRDAAFTPLTDTALLHFTTLPWLHFTSFSHARNWGREDSIPKLAFGRAEPDGARLWLPVSVEVHHALMDGVHLGRYVTALEAALCEPLTWIQSAPASASPQ